MYSLEPVAYLIILSPVTSALICDPFVLQRQSVVSFNESDEEITDLDDHKVSARSICALAI